MARKAKVEGGIVRVQAFDNHKHGCPTPLNAYPPLNAYVYEANLVESTASGDVRFTDFIVVTFEAEADHLEANFLACTLQVRDAEHVMKCVANGTDEAMDAKSKYDDAKRRCNRAKTMRDQHFATGPPPAPPDIPAWKTLGLPPPGAYKSTLVGNEVKAECTDAYFTACTSKA